MAAAHDSASGFRLGDRLFDFLGAGEGDEAFPSLADTLYGLLWRRIVNQEFPPGARLSDEALARDLGVSRTPIREALHRLSAVGLVRIEPRRGFFVPEMTREDVVELFDLRTALEVHAVRVATGLLTDEALAEHVREHVDAHRRATTDSERFEEFYRADLRFHERVHQAAGNRRSTRILVEVMGQLAIASMRHATMEERRAASVAEHVAILEAMRRRDPAAAGAAMERHVQAVKERVLQDFFPAA